MKLGTVVYKNKIYNLDYMTTEDMEKLLNTIEENKEKEIKQATEMVKNK